LSITSFLHVLRAMPDKPAHAVAISSAQVFAVHFPTALASETKPPAQSATANNVTTAFLVIVEPPVAVPMLRSISALYCRAWHIVDTLVNGPGETPTSHRLRQTPSTRQPWIPGTPRG